MLIRTINEKNNIDRLIQLKSKTPALNRLKQRLKRRQKKIGTPSTRSVKVDDFVENISLGLSDKLGFGKYKSKTIKKILSDDPMYLSWLLDNNTELRFNKVVMKELAAFVGSADNTEERYDPLTYDWSVSIEETF